MQEKYDSTLLNSRLLVFGDVGRDMAVLKSDGGERTGSQIDRLSAGSDLTTVTHDCDSTHVTGDSNHSMVLSSSDVLCYPDADESTAHIDEHIADFLMSLFWVLESKRLDRSCEHVDNLTLLTAPFEQRKDSIIADFDGRLSLFILCSGARSNNHTRLASEEVLYR